MDTKEESITAIAQAHGVNTQTLRRSYKDHHSGYWQWDQRRHAQNYILFAENVTPHLSIDEVSLSRGELYTFVKGKRRDGKNGKLVAAIKGTMSSQIVSVLKRIGQSQRQKVVEVSMDMAKNMEKAIKTVFPMAQMVTDRFHVIQLAQNCLQQVRIGIWRDGVDP